MKMFKYIRPIMAYGTLILTFGIIILLFYKEVPPGNNEVLYTIAGAVTTLVISNNSYYFGNSKDKSDQDQRAMFPNENPEP